MTSLRKAAGNTGITGGIKGINNKVPQKSTKKTETTEKKPSGGWKPANNANQTPTKPPPAR